MWAGAVVGVLFHSARGRVKAHCGGAVWPSLGSEGLRIGGAPDWEIPEFVRALVCGMDTEVRG